MLFDPHNIRELNINVGNDLEISVLCNFGFDPVALLLLSFPKKIHRERAATDVNFFLIKYSKFLRPNS